jgi:hypothetical protein
MGNDYHDKQKWQISKHQQSIQNLKLENEQLTKNLNILGVELEVAILAQQRHFSGIEQALKRENTLRKDLAFYQQVMAPELNEQGFLIDGFYVEPALSADTYRYELALMQQKKTKRTLKGNVKVLLIGSENGKAKEYTLSSLLGQKNKKSLSFSFKYFQVLRGEITLPSGFQPEKVSVHATIFQFKRKKGELISVFDWLSE